ncbi:MAG: ABC transporter substrate-binding protein [Polaromonas sp.]|nr:ABC transporter substrate-binding protein [Polaromonas sp.]
MTPNRRSLLRTFASIPIVGTGLFSASLRAQTAATAGLVQVSVISFGGGFNLPLWAAKEQGFFSRNGLEVQHTVTVDSKQLFTGMIEGKYHIAITALDNILAYQEGQGEVKFDPPSDFFGFMGSDDGFLSLVASPQIKSFADLKGKTISVDAMSNGFSFALRDILARNGIAESEVQWARAGGTDRRFAALMEGQHAATMLRAPFDLQAKNRGFNQLATARDTIGAYMGIVGAARRSWAGGNEATVVSFIRAYRDSIRWLKAPENRQQAQALLMKNVPSMNEQIAAQSCDLLLDAKSGFFSDVQLDEKGVQAVMDLRSKLGEGTRKLDDPTRYVDRRYWQLAMSR